MNSRRVISTKDLPSRSPLLAFAVVYLYLDKYDVSEWIIGAVSAGFLFLYIGFLIDAFTRTSIRYFK